MKIQTKHPDFLPYIYFPLFVITILLNLAFPKQIALSFIAQGIGWFFVLFFLIAKRGGLRFPIAVRKTSWLKCLSLILLAELGITWTYYGFAAVATTLAPSNVFALPSLFTLSSQNLLWRWGLFPWSFVILIAIGLAYVSFYQRQRGVLSATLTPLLRINSLEPVGLTVDFITRMTLFFQLASVIGIGCLLALMCASSILHWSLLTGTQLNVLIVMTVIILLITNVTAQKTIRFLTTHQIPLIVIAILFMLLTSFLILLMMKILQWITIYYPLLNTRYTFFNLFMQYWPTIWWVFTGIWWLGWVPLLSGFIAYLMQGYTIRKLILITVLATLPSLFSMWWLADFSHIRLSVFLGLIGVVIILALFTQPQCLVQQMRAVVPGSTQEKQRALHQHTFGLLHTALFFVVLYLALGLFAVNFIAMLVIFPLAICLPLCVIGVLKGAK